jgi:hypothetical protein
MRIQLGDVGTLDHDNIFVRETSLDAFGIGFDTVNASEGSESVDYTTAGAVDVGFKLAGKTSDLTPNVPAASAGLGVKFAREYAIAFHADGLTRERIADQRTLAREVLSLMRAKEWDDDWSVVTEVAHADSITALIGSSSQSGVEFELGADVSAGGLELLSAKTGVKTLTRRKMNLMMVGTGGTTPLYLARRVKRKWIVGPQELRASYADDLVQLKPADDDLDEGLFEDTPIHSAISSAPDGDAAA